MSGIVSGLTKTFKTVGSGIARVTQGVTGVAGTVFTAGAAGAPVAGQSTLGRILTGAVKQAGVSALAGGIGGLITGVGFGKGALAGGLGGAISGGLFSAAGLGGGPQSISGNAQPASRVSSITAADTPTGMAPTGSTGPAAASPAGGARAASAGSVPSVPASAAPAVAANQPNGNGLRQFLTSETGGSLIAGLGSGLGAYMKAKQEAEEAEKDRQFLRDKQQRITDSYNIDPAAFPQPMGFDAARPTPAQKWNRRYQYDPNVGQIVPVPA